MSVINNWDSFSLTDWLPIVDDDEESNNNDEALLSFLVCGIGLEWGNNKLGLVIYIIVRDWFLNNWPSLGVVVFISPASVVVNGGIGLYNSISNPYK